MKALKIALTLFVGLLAMSHPYLSYGKQKGPNMAAFAPDKKIVVIDEQVTGQASNYSNTFSYSKDYGKTWTYSTSPPPDNDYNFCGPDTKGRNVFAIKYLGSQFISVGTNGVICTSPDGAEWTMANPSRVDPYKNLTIKSFYDIAFNGSTANPIYVAVGGAGLAMYSSDSQNGWQYVSNSPFGNYYDLNSIVYAQGKFVVVADDGTMWWSTDGQNWTKGTLNPSGSANFEKVIYEPQANAGKGQFIVVGSKATIAYSSDGENWTVAQMSDSSETYFTDVTYGSGTFVAVGNDDTAAWSSDDGRSWTANTSALESEAIVDHPHAVIYDDKRFIAVTANSYPDGCIFTSTDGQSWLKATIFDAKTQSPVDENYLATIIKTDQGVLAVPYGAGDATALSPADIVVSNNAIKWTAVCDLGFDCFPMSTNPGHK